MKHHKINILERDQIAIWHHQGFSNKQISIRLGRSVSSIGRELKRNTYKSVYTAISAEKMSQDRNSRSRKFNALKNPQIYRYVVDKLRRGWSPEQIAGRLRRRFKHTIVCHETIYRYIYNTQDGRTQQLWDYLPRHRPRRYRWLGRRIKHVGIPERVSIHDRPYEVTRNKEFGHWEIDAVEGSKHQQAIATLLERVSRYYQAVKLSNLDAEYAIQAHIGVLGMYPAFARKTATFDNGKENTKHTKLTQYFGVETYFCDPYCSWQKGSNEYHNGLLRRYIPKKTNFATFSQVELDSMVEEINNRPRKCLNYATPKEVFMRYLSSRGVAIESRI